MANVEIIAPKRELILNSDSGLYEERKKRVCAYCRVSTDDIDQQNSYQVQVNEYTKRIKSNPRLGVRKDLRGRRDIRDRHQKASRVQRDDEGREGT